MTLISGYQSTTVTNLFQYDASLNPAVVSLSRNRSGIAGEKAAHTYWAQSAGVLLLLMVVAQREFMSMEFGDPTVGFGCFLLPCRPRVSC